MENQDVITAVLSALRQRSGRTHFIKVKSHAGCLMNKRAEHILQMKSSKKSTVSQCPTKARQNIKFKRSKPFVQTFFDEAQKNKQQIQKIHSEA